MGEQKIEVSGAGSFNGNRREITWLLAYIASEGRLALPCALDAEDEQHADDLERLATAIATRHGLWDGNPPPTDLGRATARQLYETLDRVGSSLGTASRKATDEMGQYPDWKHVIDARARLDDYVDFQLLRGAMAEILARHDIVYIEKTHNYPARVIEWRTSGEMRLSEIVTHHV